MSLQEGAWVAQIAVGIFGLIGLGIAVRQAREASKIRRLQATRDLIGEIGNEEVRRARRWVLETEKLSMASRHSFEDLQGEARQTELKRVHEGLDEQERGQAFRVAVALDRVGFLVSQGLIPEDALFEWQQDEIVQIWQKLKLLVFYVREIGRRPHYCEKLGYLAEEWFPRRTIVGR